MKTFHAGDKVRFISSKGSGIVTSVKKNIVHVLIEDGFEIPVEASDLVIIDQQEGKKNPFAKKDEFSKVQSNTVISKNKSFISEKSDNSTTTSSNSPNKENQKTQNTSVSPATGIYLAFIPDNQDVLISGNMDIYLINYSKWQVAFHALKSDPGKGFASVSCGLMDKGDAILIETVTEQDARHWNRLRLQLVCFDQKESQLFDSEIVDIDIKTSKFIKEDIYTENPFFDELAHVIFVHDLTHPPLTGRKSDMIHENPEKKTNTVIDRYMTDKNTAEVDLHIEKLRSDHKTMRKDEIMPVQLAFFRQCIDAAITKKLSRAVFIHGVGAGLLKKELTDILKTYPDLEYEDASIMKYGIGATEVRFKNR
ncbi:MAG: DUF2027 domain-containing protein [Bacteroidales bacterium]